MSPPLGVLGRAHSSSTAGPSSRQHASRPPEPPKQHTWQVAETQPRASYHGALQRF